MIKTKVITVCHAPCRMVHSKFAIRKRYVEEQFLPRLNSLGFDAEIFPAVTGMDAELKDGVAYYKDLAIPLGRQSSYIYVFLSHLLMWKRCAQNGGTLVVCEDDARLPDSSVDVVKQAIRDYEEDEDRGDLLYLQSELPYSKEAIREYKPKNLEPAHGSLLRVRKVTDTAGAAGYALRPKAAAALVKRAEECEQNSPDAYFHLAHEDGRIGIVVPKDFRNMFMLHEVWEPYNHEPS